MPADVATDSSKSQLFVVWYEIQKSFGFFYEVQ